MKGKLKYWMNNNSGKKTGRMPRSLAITGVILGAVFFAVGRFVRGLGFLFLIFALLCFFGAFCAALFLPFKGERVKKLIRGLKIFALVFLIVGAISFAAVQGLIISGWPDNEGIEAQCLIVLGAGLNGERLSYVLHSRVELAADYLLEHPDAVAVVSGGQGPGESIPEALAMKRYIVGRGVDESRIIMEDQSSSTLENLRFSKDKLEEYGLDGKSVAIVSNSYHLFRAGKIAQSLGIEAQALGAPVPKIPLTPLSCYVREYFSVMLMFFRSIGS